MPVRFDGSGDMNPSGNGYTNSLVNGELDFNALALPVVFT